MPQVYCWRCCRFVRTLTDEEYDQCHRIIKARKGVSRAIAISDAERERRLAALAHEELKLSDGEHIDVTELLRHRLDRFGPPCKHCGKNLRTPRARMCAACGREA